MQDKGQDIAIVTGGHNGILGPVWADELVRLGFLVYILDLPDCDLRRKEDVEKAAAALFRDGLYPSVVVNNAAIDNPPGSQTSFFGNFPDIISVNLTGAVNVCEAFIPTMIKRGGGTIVNIGSIQGRIGADWRNYEGNFEKPVGYNISKAGLRQLSRSITTQYGRYNVRAVTLAFGAVESPKLQEPFAGKFLRNVPLGRFVSEKSLRAAMRFAVQCPEAAGQEYMIDGGYTAW